MKLLIQLHCFQSFRQFLSFKILTSTVQHSASRVRRPKSSVQSPASRAQCPESSAQGPESSIQSPVSRVQRPESSVQGPASSVQRPASRVQRPESRVQRPTLASRVLEFRCALYIWVNLAIARKLALLSPKLNIANLTKRYKTNRKTAPSSLDFKLLLFFTVL